MAKDNAAPPATPSPSFEEAFAQLERTVQALEAGGLTLERATNLFQDGMRLARSCHDMLDATELKVKQLQVNFGQQIRLIDGEGNGPC
ncbi:MAG: exodeoxyribonuclease VII small subunit [Chloroflexi bacterium]|nr:exodeoxyribonuclease VII small subunit [Chloroflexota bacterium]